ncbi:hypothetical protein TWF730_006768 [Orbilia blumenaviensis]|uniref:F-box domain-containing protein n=1 Tax=Orbilia blumenaviensis TaxID=1796055 RepID=A0AAV9VGP2_9PEZI
MEDQEYQEHHVSWLLSSLAGNTSAPPPDTAAQRKGIEQTSRAPSITLLDLPYDILSIIFEHVPPYEIPRLRRVSRAFNIFLTKDHVLSPLLRFHFPYHVRDSLHGGAAPQNNGTAESEAVPANTTTTNNSIIAGAPQAFDSALKRFFNRARGKPTSITVISGVRLDACYETETSYDHMFLVFHHISGRVFIYDSGNRFPQHPYVTLDVRGLGVPWFGYRMNRRNVRQSVVLDKRILIVSGTREFEGDPERRIPQAVYSLHKYPEVEFLGIWRGVSYHEHLNSLCANDEWIGCRVNRHYIKLIKISSLRQRPVETEGSATTPTQLSRIAPAPHPYELTFHHPSKGFIKDVHLAKDHVFVYSVIMDEDENGHGQIDVFSINLIPNEHRDTQLYEIAHVRSVVLHAWQGMFMEYIGYKHPEDVPEAMRCQRWDKIYPFMKGNRHHGMPEEDGESVMMTLGKTFRANGNIPIGCARIFAKAEKVNRQGEPPIVETVAPENIIPFCVELEQSIQEDDASHTLLLPRSKRKEKSRAEILEENEGQTGFVLQPWDPDVPSCPDAVQLNAGNSQDSLPGDDAAYLLHFGNGNFAFGSEKAEPTLPSPSIREAWYLDQDQTQRTSVVTEEGLFHIFYDEAAAESPSKDLSLPALTADGNGDGNQALKKPINLIPSHMQHIPLEEIFDSKIPLLEVSFESPTIGDTASRLEENVNAKKTKLDKLMRSVRGGWSCYVWSAETWNGFLITTSEDAKMVVLRYD